MDVLHRAHGYLLTHARLLDRLRFEALFAGGPRDRVLDTLRCYQNPDGGFGHALEPDLRGAASQPEPVEIAFWILDELDAFADPMVRSACDYLVSVTTPPTAACPSASRPSARRRARPGGRPRTTRPATSSPPPRSLGLLHKHGIDHPWRGPATDFCWRSISAVDKTTPYEARAIVTFLDLVDDEERARSEFQRLKDAILATVTFDPEASGDAHFPLDFAPPALCGSPPVHGGRAGPPPGRPAGGPVGGRRLER
ncbi:hypothetical protein ACFSTC_44970 [Nonomuraea ferruginea]